MDLALRISQLALRIVASAFLATAAYVCFTVSRAVEAESRTIASSVDSHLSEMQKTLNDRTVDALTKVDSAVKSVDRVVDKLEGTKNTLLVVGLHLAGRVDDRLGEVITQVTELRSEISPILKSAESTLRQIEDAAPPFLDCDHNPDCAFNRYVGVSKSTEATMRSVSAAVPKLLETADSVGKNVELGSRKYVEVAQDTDTLLKRMTPPKFPNWLKWTIGLAPPIAQTGASMVGIGAITGLFK